LENWVVKRSRFGGFSGLTDLEFYFRLSKGNNLRGRNLRGSNRPLNAKSEIQKVRSSVTAVFCDIYFDSLERLNVSSKRNNFFEMSLTATYRR
jgi:hypothetical protein